MINYLHTNSDGAILTVNHSDPSSYRNTNYSYFDATGQKVNYRYPDGAGWLDNGSAPVEVGADLLSQRIKQTLSQVQSGKQVTDADTNDQVDGINPFTYIAPGDVSQTPVRLAIRRVDIVAWSYGGVITRWYINSGATTSQVPAPSLSWYKRPGATVTAFQVVGTYILYAFFEYETPSVPYGGDIRKVFTLGSMWRGVPLVNYVNEVLFSKPDGFYNAPILGKSLPPPFTTLGSATDTDNFISRKLPAKLPSMEVMAVNSPWETQMIYRGDPFQQSKPGIPQPFENTIAYGSVAGDNNDYPIFDVKLLGLDPTFRHDPYSLLDFLQSPSWFPYLTLERRTNSDRNFSDGLVPLWSSAIPGSYKLSPCSHNAYPSDFGTQEYVTQWLNNALLPQGSSLNNVWSTSVSSWEPMVTWTFQPNMMAPLTQNLLYTQTGGIGRLSPAGIQGTIPSHPVIKVVLGAVPPIWEVNSLSFPIVVSNSGTPAHNFRITSILFYKIGLDPTVPGYFVLFPTGHIR